MCIASQYGPRVWYKKGQERGVCSCSAGKVPMPKLNLFQLEEVFYSAPQQEQSDHKAGKIDCKKQYTCKECNYTTPDWSNHFRHMKTHEKKDGYVCGTCPRKFISRVALLDHRESDHGQDARNECPHPGCGKKVSDLKGHLFRHKKKEEMAFECICGSKFSQAHHLKRHQVKKGCIGPADNRVTSDTLLSY